jgi:hypothetical protein
MEALMRVAEECLAGNDADTVEAVGLAPKGEGDRFLSDLHAGSSALAARINRILGARNGAA